MILLLDFAVTIIQLEYAMNFTNAIVWHNEQSLSSSTYLEPKHSGYDLEQ